MQRTHQIIYKIKEQVLPWQHLLPGSVENLVSSNLCWGLESRGMECKEPTKIFIYGSKKQKKSVGMATIVARYC